jgi:hypothetical protein
VGAGTSAGLVSKPSSDPVSPQSLASYAGAASRRIASDPTQWTLTNGSDDAHRQVMTRKTRAISWGPASPTS